MQRQKTILLPSVATINGMEGGEVGEAGEVERCSRAIVVVASLCEDDPKVLQSYPKNFHILGCFLIGRISLMKDAVSDSLGVSGARL
jgi:hypothetical protein